MPILDSYERFIEHFELGEKFIDWALDETVIFGDEHSGFEQMWFDIKLALIKNANIGTIYVRKNGVNGSNSNILLSIYKKVFPNVNIKVDMSNNNTTHSKVNKLGNYRRNKGNEQKYIIMKNYKVSHIFANTANPFLFHAPWNFCLTPIIVDPLTGHESSGKISSNYKKSFFDMVFKKNQKYIDDYNKILEDYDFHKKVKQAIEELRNDGLNIEDSFEDELLSQWEPIKKENYI